MQAVSQQTVSLFTNTKQDRAKKDLTLVTYQKIASNQSLRAADFCREVLPGYKKS